MRFTLVLIIALASCFHGNAQYNPQRYPVIPRPQTILPLSDNFPLSSAVTIVTEEKSGKKECEFFRQQVLQLYNFNLRYGKYAGFQPYIYVQLDSSFVPSEGYRLIVTKQGIDVYGTRAGIFYGLETVLQLIQKDPTGTSLIIPGCSIIDYPRFAWRGMHLDVSRHFFPAENVKEYLRYMAMYKLNTFHWHLTDDQGWRIEIKKYPLLTSIGSWRNATLIGHYSAQPARYDSTRYGGFYTQDEVKEIVRYADSLHITVVPEIEMPGHASALLAAYPAFGCKSSGGYRVEGTWGVFEDVLCPKEETFTALFGILDEVCALFPGKYIHIGGDECPKEEWKTNKTCTDLVQSLKLKNVDSLQSWFTQRIANYLVTKGKNAIGWDEILEGGLADGAAVMSWRGEEGGIAAAKAHHNVVMSPGGYCYFDHYQSRNANEPLAIGGYLPIEKVYSYDPVPASLSAEEKKYIMGVQANVWTEYIPTFSQVQYMVFPRMAAIAEVAWSKTNVKSFNDFVPRISTHMTLYDKMKVNYSRALFEIRPAYSSSSNGILLSLTSYSKQGEIRFTHHGIELSPYDSVYTKPIRITESDTIIAAVYDGAERISPFYTQSFKGHLALGKSVTLRKLPSSSYNNGGATTLVDGIIGRTPWTGSEWLGWWGDTLDATIDMGAATSANKIEVVCLRDSGSWIYAPNQIWMEGSMDGKYFTRLHGNVTFTEPVASQFNFIFLPIGGQQFRYLRVWCPSLGYIPEGAPGAGNPAWLFVSEIIVE